MLFASAGVSDVNEEHLFKTVFSYDESGNQVSMTDPGGNVSKYIFDTLNQLTSVEGPGSAPEKYGYGPGGTCVSITKGDGGQPRYFLRGACGRAILAEVDSKGKLIRRYLVLPDGRMAGHVDTLASKVTFYHFDALGSTIATTDSKGRVTSRTYYEPFGASQSVPGSGELFAFVGEYGVQNGSNGLVRMGVRFYNAFLGRFLEVDPLPPSASAFQRYAYARNSPLNRIDPSGLQDTVTETYKKAVATGDTETLEALASNEELDPSWREMCRNVVQRLRSEASVGAPERLPPCELTWVQRCLVGCDAHENSVVRALCKTACVVGSVLKEFF